MEFRPIGHMDPSLGFARTGAVCQVVVQIQQGRPRKGGEHFGRAIERAVPVTVEEVVRCLKELQAELPGRVNRVSEPAVKRAIEDLRRKPPTGVSGVCKVLKKTFVGAGRKTWRVEVENACGTNLTS